MTKIDPSSPVNKPKADAITSFTDKQRPAIPPKSDKSFKRMMENRPEKYGDSLDADDMPEEKPPHSVYDITASKKSVTSSATQTHAPVHKPDVAKAQVNQPIDRFYASSGRPSDRSEGVSRNKDSNRSTESKDQPKAKEKTSDKSYKAKRKSEEGDDDVQFQSHEVDESNVARQSGVVDTRLTSGEHVGFEAEKSKATPIAKEVKSEKTSSESTRFDYVQPTADLSAGGATFNLNPQTTASSDAAARANLAENLQALASQLITVKTKGQLDTVVVLENPPMFKGATVKISSFESAQGQWNISIAGLRPDAKLLLDQQLDSLKGALSEKGLVVHMLTTTTQVETPIARGEVPLPNREGRGEGQPGEGKQQQRQRQKDEEEMS